MIELNLQNFQKVVSTEKWKSFEKKLSSSLKNFPFRQAGLLPSSEQNEAVKKIENFVANISGNFSDIVLLGIGGSALGARTLRDTLARHPLMRLRIIDTLDSDFIADIESQIDLEQTLFLVVSKSGGTFETLLQYRYFREKIDSVGLKPEKHFVFVTDPKVGMLRQIAEKEKIPTLEIPSDVGGRFCIFTPAALIPGRFLEVDIAKLVHGAEKMKSLAESETFEKNIPFQLASILLASQKSRWVLMPYCQRLKSFTAWWSQLIAESTGKNSQGFTPLMATGPTDQHSLLQLLAQGPDDFLTIFVRVKSEEKKKPFGAAMAAELEATAQSLTELNRPSLIIELSDLSAETMGELFALWMATTTFLGELLEINVFDQPGVERGKILTQSFLKK